MHVKAAPKAPKATPDPIELCTRDQVKTFLTLTDNLSDAMIDQLIPAVSAQLLHAINRLDLIPNKDYVDYIPGQGAPKLYLKHYPVNAITEVSVFGEIVDEWNESYPSTSGWRFTLDPNPENQQFIELVGLVYGQPYCYCWPYAPSNVPNIIIRYNAGYEAIPPAIQQATIEWVAFKRNMSQVQNTNPAIGSEQIGDYSEGLGSGRIAIDYMGIEIPAGVMNVIDAFRRWTV